MLLCAVLLGNNKLMTNKELLQKCLNGKSAFCSTKIGNGKQLIKVYSDSSFPSHWLIFVGSEVKFDDHARIICDDDYLERIMSAIEDEFGRNQDDLGCEINEDHEDYQSFPCTDFYTSFCRCYKAII